jgi:signal transduction histidine kinase
VTGTLRLRITVVASLAITAAVAGGIVLLYVLQVQAVSRTIDGQLRAYAVEVAESASTGVWPDPLPPSTVDADAQAQVIDDGGHVIAASRNLAGMPQLYALPPGTSTPVRLKVAEGVIPNEVKVIGIRTVVRGQPVTIMVGTPTSLLSQLRDRFTSSLLLGFPVILLIAAAAVWLIVGRALRPVERIRLAVTDITSLDLSRRVPEPGTADEIGQLARTMNDMLDRLEAAARRQRRFVADTSHELRTPLAAIRTTLEVGLAHPDQAPWTVIANRAAQQSNRLEELVQQLLMLARADERALTVHEEHVDVGQLLRDVAATTVSPGVDIRTEITGTPTALGDAAHLTRLARNVVDNAVRHATATVHLAAVTSDGHVTIDVTDDGPGVPVADRERIFDRFVRLDSSRERGNGNGTTGLGLAIARELATAHHGTITASDNPAGDGARFTIRLPAAARQ